MRFVRVVAVVALAAMVPLVLGLGWAEKKGKMAAHASEFDQVAKLVKKIYEGASNPEAAVVMAELAIFDMGKKGKIADAPARLQRVLEQTQKTSLRNFTQFLIAASLAENKAHPKAADGLEGLIKENLTKLGDAEPK
ncbi:hypothetical protein ACFL59_09290 [Planctomycetota bacterium]